MPAKKKHGATVHWVTEKLDDGAVIAQAEVKITKDDTAETLAAKVLREEHKIYSQAIKKFIENQL